MGVRKVLNKHGVLLYEYWQIPNNTTKTFTGGTWNLIDDNPNQVIIKLNSENYDKEKMIYTKFYEIFVIDTLKKEFLDRFKEKHEFRVYHEDQMKDILTMNGFVPIGFYADTLVNGNLTTANESTFRVLCAAKVSS